MTFLLVVLCACWFLVFWTYILFPLVLVAWSRLFGREPVFAPASDCDLPRVAVVVAAYNEEVHTPSKLANTWALDYPAEKLRLFYGSDGSVDGTNLILKCGANSFPEGLMSSIVAGAPSEDSFPEGVMVLPFRCAPSEDSRLIPLIYEERRGKVSVVNSIMECSELAAFAPDVVVLSDANSMYAPDAIRKLVRHFADARVGCVNGELEYEHGGGASGEGLYWKYELWLKRLESRLNFVIGCYGGILAIRPEAYRPPPADTIVEDFVISMGVLEQGYAVRLDREARAIEPASASASAEWGRKVRIGAGNYQALGLTRGMLAPRHGFKAVAFWSHKVLRWFVPFFLLGALAANFGLVAFEGISSPCWAAATLFLQLAGVAIAVWAFRQPAGARPPLWTKPFSYFYLMNYGLFCGFVRHVRRSQPVTWQSVARQAAKENLTA